MITVYIMCTHQAILEWGEEALMVCREQWQSDNTLLQRCENICGFAIMWPLENYVVVASSSKLNLINFKSRFHGF